MNADRRSLEDDLLTPPAHRALGTGRRLSTRRKPEEKEKGNARPGAWSRVDMRRGCTICARMYGCVLAAPGSRCAYFCRISMK